MPAADVPMYAPRMTTPISTHTSTIHDNATHWRDFAAELSGLQISQLEVFEEMWHGDDVAERLIDAAPTEARETAADLIAAADEIERLAK